MLRDFSTFGRWQTAGLAWTQLPTTAIKTTCNQYNIKSMLKVGYLNFKNGTPHT